MTFGFTFVTRIGCYRSLFFHDDIQKFIHNLAIKYKNINNSKMETLTSESWRQLHCLSWCAGSRCQWSDVNGKGDVNNNRAKQHLLLLSNILLIIVLFSHSLICGIFQFWRPGKTKEDEKHKIGRQKLIIHRKFMNRHNLVTSESVSLTKSLSNPKLLVFLFSISMILKVKWKMKVNVSRLKILWSLSGDYTVQLIP